MEIKHFGTADDFAAIIRGAGFSRLTRLKQIATGWTNYVFFAEVKGFWGKRKFIFRFPRNEFFAKAMIKEVRATKLIRKKMPRITAKQKLLYDGARPFSVHKYIKGTPLTDAYKDLSAAQKERLVRDIYSYLERLHKMVIPDLELLSKFLTDLAGVNDGRYDFSRLAPLEKAERKKVCLVHGDFNPGNIILNRRGRLRAVLDYAFVSYSCAFADVSRIVGRLPDDFARYLDAVCHDLCHVTCHDKCHDMRAQTSADGCGARLGAFVDMWRYVETDYIEYMRRVHPDIEIGG